MTCCNDDVEYDSETCEESENYLNKRYPRNKYCICHSICIDHKYVTTIFTPRGTPGLFERLFICNPKCEYHPVCEGSCKRYTPHNIKYLIKKQFELSNENNKEYINE